MKAVLTNFGSTGDVQPFLALGVELLRHGHTPLLALSPGFGARARELGLAFVEVGRDLRAAQDSINRTMVDRGMDPGETALGGMGALFGPLAEALPEMVDSLRAACAGADLLVCGRIQFAGRIVHDLTRIPFATVHVEHSGAGGGHPAFREAIRAVVNPVRARFGLPGFENPLVENDSPQLVLHAQSPHVRVRPSEWPAHQHVSGFLFLDEAGWEPAPALVAFLEAGAPPWVVTLGSMPAEDPRALARIFAEAAAQAGERLVIQRGWAELEKSVDADHVFPVGFVPHDWLLPRAAGVIHHGGAGTTAASFRAGAPQVVIPHAYDQFLWAERVHELGCGAAPLSRDDSSVERVSQAMRDAGASAVRRCAAELGARVRAEQGALRARELLQGLVHGVGPEATVEDALPRRRNLLSEQRSRRTHE